MACNNIAVQKGILSQMLGKAISNPAYVETMKNILAQAQKVTVDQIRANNWGSTLTLSVGGVSVSINNDGQVSYTANVGTRAHNERAVAELKAKTEEAFKRLGTLYGIERTKAVISSVAKKTGKDVTMSNGVRVMTFTL